MNENRRFFSQFKKMNTQNQRSAMKVYVKQVNSQIEEIVFEMRKVLTASKKQIFGFLLNHFSVLYEDEYNKFETVLIIDVHTRDMVDMLIRDGINESHDL